MNILNPFRVPSVNLLVSPSVTAKPLGRNFTAYLASCRAGGLPFLEIPAATAPQRVLVYDSQATRQELEAEFDALARALGLPGRPDTLRLLGRGGAPGQTFAERLRIGVRQHQPELVVLLNAEQAPACSAGTGASFPSVEVAAWGLEGPYGSGRGVGALGWQRTFAEEHRVAFLNHFTVTPSSVFAYERQAFERNADYAVELKPERPSEPRGRQLLVEPDGTRLFLRSEGDDLWKPVEP